MHKTIIADTSCLITLTSIGQLELLHTVYGNVITTPEVKQEFGQPLPPWINLQTPADTYRQRILEITVDKGEASVIALSLEMPESIIVLDDQKARNIAERLELVITGTIGVLIKAKLNGIIPSIIPHLQKMKTVGFYVTRDLEQEALKQANELPVK